jgi:hypothetical protein
MRVVPLLLLVAAPAGAVEQGKPASFAFPGTSWIGVDKLEKGLTSLRAQSAKKE